ncbi:MAG: hypothetical protein ACYC33_00060 [Thermoleophilia bacterium]
MDRSRAWPPALLLTASLLAGPLVTGCGGGADASQTRVETAVTQDATKTTVSPLERGKIRREVLRVAEEGMAAWLTDDLDAASEYWSKDNVDRFREQDESYAEEGKRRVREHSSVTMDAVDMSSIGDQAIVEYNFTDDSHFVDSAGKQIGEPTHKETLFQLTLQIEDEGVWRIERVIGASESLQ